MTEFTPLPLENTSFSDFFRFYCFTTTEYCRGGLFVTIEKSLVLFAAGEKLFGILRFVP